MTKARILTTDEEIDAALEAAKHAEPTPAVTKVEYLGELCAISIHVNTGQRLLLPVEDMQFLNTARPEQLYETEIVRLGSGIGFPVLDAHFSVEGLLAGRYGNRRWMEQLEARRAAALKAAA